MNNMFVKPFNFFKGITDVRLNDIRLIGSITLTAILGLQIGGIEWVARVHTGLLGLLIISQVPSTVCHC